MKLRTIGLALLLAGCAGADRPHWRDDAVRWLETYRTQALAGETKLARTAHANALREFKRGADWEGLAVAQLTRCAIERATDGALAGCAAYREQRPLGASAALDAYARWLEGGLALADVGLLPAAYRGVAAAVADGNSAALAERVFAIESPLSTLVALAVVWRQLPQLQPALAACAALAGQQGWLAAHRACLAREIGVLKEGGDAAAAAERERRLRLLGS